MKQNYDLLRSKDIIAILDGDTQIEELDGLRIAMPYLSGPMLCELSQKFGYYQEYYWGNGSKPNLSRWQYMDNILEYVIKENKVNQLLSYMMDKERFSDNLRKLNNVSDIEKKYKYIIQKVLDFQFSWKLERTKMKRVTIKFEKGKKWKANIHLMNFQKT